MHSTSYITVPLSSALFCICTRTTPDTFFNKFNNKFQFHDISTRSPLTRDAHCRIPCSPNMDCPMCGLHPPPMHAHCTRITIRGCYERQKRGKGRELARLSTPLQKVPVRNLAFHVMPRQRSYPNDFGQITIFAWSLLGILWNAYDFQAFAVTRIFLRIFQALPACHGMPRHSMKCQISQDAYDIHIRVQFNTWVILCSIWSPNDYMQFSLEKYIRIVHK